MTDEQGKLIDSLLADWHRWCARPSDEGGYPKECPSCRGYRTSRQYDTDNGAADGDTHSRLMLALDGMIQRTIQGQYLTALQIEARNLAAGAKVFSSPRMTKQELNQAIGIARGMFASMLRQSEMF